MDKVFIKDLTVHGIIGVNNWERETPQDILINITVFTETRPADKEDDLTNCVDYNVLAENIQKYTKTAARFTVEALAEDLAALCLNENGVQKALVRVEKPGALRFSKSVGVEIERRK